MKLMNIPAIKIAAKMASAEPCAAMELVRKYGARKAWSVSNTNAAEVLEIFPEAVAKVVSYGDGPKTWKFFQIKAGRFVLGEAPYAPGLTNFEVHYAAWETALMEARELQRKGKVPA